ncbi:hypothetical protein SAMD00023353_0204240 [Rosellinia necatrix]|uniref:Uncharacterized protein n=1 Tax=Rosellinia necatrix TaxID=77044 RepID=A0A1S8A527_ROSNE|nr:hypothetical protein SAMD00023353_0204240 [Rosellinia necatrix]
MKKRDLDKDPDKDPKTLTHWGLRIVLLSLSLNLSTKPSSMKRASLNLTKRRGDS